MVNFLCGWVVFILSFAVMASLFIWGPDAGIGALQGSALILASLFGMFAAMRIINAGDE